MLEASHRCASVQPIAIAHALAGAAFDAWLGIEGRDDLDDEVGMGADGTATTRADRLVEEAMLEVAAEVGVDVLSEEAGFVDNGAGLVAVIDPVDGTRNAGRGVPFFCTSVAVGRRDLTGVQAGVVQNLVTGDSYAAVRGKGANVNGGAASGRDVTRRDFDRNDVLVGLIADYADVDTVTMMQRRNWHIRDLGSAALELCLVGTGALDAFHVPKPWLRVIDIAAGTLFVREAGGRVVAPGTATDLEVPFDITARTGITAVHDAVALEAFQ